MFKVGDRVRINYSKKWLDSGSREIDITNVGTVAFLRNHPNAVGVNWDDFQPNLYTLNDGTPHGWCVISDDLTKAGTRNLMIKQLWNQNKNVLLAEQR